MPFQKGNTGKPKGAKNRETIVKEALMNNLWDQVSGKMTGEGIDRCFNEMQKLDGKDYVYAFLSMLEYFKPKLNRTTLSGDEDNPLNLSIPAINVYNTAPPLNNNENAVEAGQ